MESRRASRWINSVRISRVNRSDSIRLDQTPSGSLGIGRTLNWRRVSNGARMLAFLTRFADLFLPISRPQEQRGAKINVRLNDQRRSMGRSICLTPRSSSLHTKSVRKFPRREPITHLNLTLKDSDSGPRSASLGRARVWRNQK